MQTPEGRQALITSHGFDLAFFTERPVFSEALRKPLSAEKMEQAAKVHRGLLAHHCRFVLHPASLQVSIQWRFADDDTFALQLPHSSYGEKPRSPFLLIDATNVLEAVAATFYADRVHNIVNDKCKQCGKLFPVQSGHGQQFCPPNAATSTSSCKKAYLQKQLRTRDSLAVDFLLSRRTQGMTKAQSIKAATSQMIHVSKRALTRADEKWAKPNRVKTAAQAHSKKPVTSG